MVTSPVCDDSGTQPNFSNTTSQITNDWLMGMSCEAFVITGMTALGDVKQAAMYYVYPIAHLIP